MPKFQTRNCPSNKVASAAAAYENYFGLTIGVHHVTGLPLAAELTGDFNAAQTFFRRCTEYAADVGSLRIAAAAAAAAAVPVSGMFDDA